MLKSTLSILLICISLNSYADEAFDKLSLKVKEIGEKKFTEGTYNPKILKHIVILKYKKSVTEKQKDVTKRRFLQLQKSRRSGEKNPYILSIITGAQNSGEKANMGFEQAFIVTFRSEGDRNYYVGSPIVNNPAFFDKQHDAFKKFVGPLLVENNGALVFDFNVEPDL
ncbi:Dabb family protein [Serratia bockelmannii]|uniref:Dabb family protein n=1 Tax=Serratia bockelmannii TaxID=2703793 RepID=UPI003FA7219F